MSPAVHVAWYWVEMGVWVHGEPGAYIVVTLVSLIREDFIDGASWMLLECWGQMPELARVDGTVWGCLWSEGLREVVRCHPLLSRVQISKHGDGVLV